MTGRKVYENIPKLEIRTSIDLAPLKLRSDFVILADIFLRKTNCSNVQKTLKVLCCY